MAVISIPLNADAVQPAGLVSDVGARMKQEPVFIASTQRLTAQRCADLVQGRVWSSL